MLFLIANENRVVRETVQKNLMTSQHTFTECTNGTEVVEKYAYYRFYWMILGLEADFLVSIAPSRKIIRSFPDEHIVKLNRYNDPQKKSYLKRG